MNSTLIYTDDKVVENKIIDDVVDECDSEESDSEEAEVSESASPIHSKQNTLLYSANGILNFYKNEINKKIFLSIIKQETAISLRLLDWLVTNYSKKYDIHYELGQQTGEYTLSNKNFNLWMDYKNQLKSYSKKNFDPFCRRQRIFFNTKTYSIDTIGSTRSDFYKNNNSGIITTVGQLNFFRWAITNKVIDYAFDNINNIESDMLSSADKRVNNKTGKRLLSKNNSCAKSQKLKIIVQFT
jgi:hypothetical protein